jgi:hypothetical protein
MCFYRVKRKPRPKPAKFFDLAVKERSYGFSVDFFGATAFQAPEGTRNPACNRQSPGATVASAVQGVAGIDDPGHIL